MPADDADREDTRSDADESNPADGSDPSNGPDLTDERDVDDGPDADTEGEPEGAFEDGSEGHFDRVVARVRERVDPDAAERTALRDAAAVLVERAEAAATERCPDADVVRVGSSARGTWISGDRDIDVFVRFPSELDRETLVEYGLAVGHATLPEGREKYAEHPYVSGEFEGFDVDVVPCFRLERATDIRSAVDRTPFHDRYLQARLDDELASEVRVAKGLMKGIGVYGSDLRTRGFGGYLVELLVCQYGGFRPLLEAAANWQPPVWIDPEGHGALETASPSRDGMSGVADLRFEDPLVVIDPTDPERNVAAVCTAENVARLQHHARDLLESPRIEPFEPHTPEPLSEADLREHLRRRGTTPVAIRFDAPDLVDDQLYPQLEKSRAGVATALDARGFDVFRTAAFADETGVLFFELAVTERPRLERHEGPPVHVRPHAEGFYEAYADDPAAYGPFVDGDRYVVERPREFASAREFLESERLLDLALGAHVETALEAGHEVLIGGDVVELVDEFGDELARYFDPRP